MGLFVIHHTIFAVLQRSAIEGTKAHCRATLPLVEEEA